jgi:hypothetical protein
MQPKGEPAPLKTLERLEERWLQPRRCVAQKIGH